MNSHIRMLHDNISKRLNGMANHQVPPELYEPVSYCMDLGGKRMRPLMVLLGSELFGGEVELAMPAAIGMELFHNFTLMHDDIMDNAPIRRGKPSVHERWNRNTAILSGDVMFAMAYRNMFQVPDDKLREVLALFNKTVIEVCEGQQYDMNFESMKHVSESEYLEMIRLKTAVLPAACLQTGAMIAGASREEAERLYRFGELVGIAFQLKDDWLDVYGDEKVFGKKSGGDIIANKKTWLYIKALELSDPSQKKSLLEAFSNNTTDPDEKIRNVKGIYDVLGIGARALARMEEYHDKAFEALDQIEVPDENKRNLISLVRSLFSRDN